MNWYVEVLCGKNRRTANPLKRNSKLPLDDRLRVKYADDGHPKNRDVDKMGPTYEICGTVEADNHLLVFEIVSHALVGVADPDGFVEIAIEPK